MEKLWLPFFGRSVNSIPTRKKGRGQIMPTTIGDFWQVFYTSKISCLQWKVFWKIREHFLVNGFDHRNLEKSKSNIPWELLVICKNSAKILPNHTETFHAKIVQISISFKGGSTLKLLILIVVTYTENNYIFNGQLY